MPLKLKLHSAPAVEPVGSAEAKAHSRISLSDEDTLIDALIVAARQMAEQVTNRALITQTWKLYLDEFPSGDCIDLPYSPLQSVTSVSYIDTDGATQTFSNTLYDIDTISEPGRLVLKPDSQWPDTKLGQVNAVTITYIVGYGDDAEDVPEPIKLAIKFLVGHWFENRELSSPGVDVSLVPKTFDWILMPWRVFR